MPSAEETRACGFKLSIENETLVGMLCRQGANGECTPVEEGKEGGYAAVGNRLSVSQSGAAAFPLGMTDDFFYSDRKPIAS